ncbi:hypothetical protein EDB80DRAFT_145654 [Ilyonectria destructans]|nr:hypothetical protein EDB80DRAFT_145654 [Ilyonectria destructans]
MRVQLKHVLPLALLLTGVAAKTTTGDSSSTAVSDASATGDQTTATTDATNTGDESGTATGTAADKTDKSDKKTAKTKADKTTTAAKDTWVASVQATVAPDLNAGAVSLKDPGFIVLGLAFGMMMVGTAFL